MFINGPRTGSMVGTDLTRSAFGYEVPAGVMPSMSMTNGVNVLHSEACPAVHGEACGRHHDKPVNTTPALTSMYPTCPTTTGFAGIWDTRTKPTRPKERWM